MDLREYGWDAVLEESFREYSENNLLPARVIEVNRLGYKLVSEKGAINGRLSEKFRKNSLFREELPTVGDWVAYEPRALTGFVSIQGLVKRKSKFSRKVIGSGSEEHVIAANVDTIFVVSGLDRDYNIRRLERYAILAGDSNAELVFILNKADLCKDLEQIRSEIKKSFPDTPVYAISALNNQGIEQLAAYISKGKTVVFLGSSGAGKSTIVNLLLGENRQKTGDVSGYSGKGRHITSSKNLMVLPGGGLVIDTPGLRELQLLCSGAGLNSTFADIETLAGECKYKTCTHTNEPKCAVTNAVKEGLISQERLDNYNKLKREIIYNVMRRDAQYKNKKSTRSKNISRRAKQIKKSRESAGDRYLGG
ncbi:MAG: ribosome small subunit-dependent GTPase A [Candidatus Altiarchaeia archaeon]